MSIFVHLLSRIVGALFGLGPSTGQPTHDGSTQLAQRQRFDDDERWLPFD